jgi:hypothetical protein
MAVDNLPCELPKMPARIWRNVLEHVFPSFFNGDKDEVLKELK